MKRRRQTPYYKNRTLRKTKRTASSHRRHRSRTHNNMGNHYRRGKKVRIVGG